MLMAPITETPALDQPGLVMCRLQSPFLIPRQPDLVISPRMTTTALAVHKV